MATPQRSPQNSHTSHTWISNSSSASASASIPSSSTPTSKMNDLPSQLLPAQSEAQRILDHLLTKLKDPESKHYHRYGKWIERHPKLNDFCLRAIRPQVWSYLSGRWSLDALKTISGDLKSDSRAIYLNGILGLDKRVRLYIGQASSLRPRVAQHLNFRYRRDNPSLHYHALQNSIYNTIGTLAVLPSQGMGNHTLPGMDEPALLLNVLEMWMCLMFRSLPAEVICEWIPDGVDPARKAGKEGVFGGLNIRSPLDQGDSKAEWVDLSESDDPLVREYVDARVVKNERLNVEDEVNLRKREYAERARMLNQGRNEVVVTANSLLVFGVGLVLGLALMKGFGVPVQRR